MTQEDKILLLKDLSGRLQYNVQILADIDKTFEGGVIGTLKVINLKKDWVELQNVLTPFKFDEIKPYLRPMSSMTREERKEYDSLFKLHEDGNVYCENWEYFDWMNKHHFDCRDLISKGLALEAPEVMYEIQD